MNISIKEMPPIIHWQVSQNMDTDFLHSISQEMLDRIDIENVTSSTAKYRIFVYDLKGIQVSGNLGEKRDLPKEISSLD